MTEKRKVVATINNKDYYKDELGPNGQKLWDHIQALNTELFEMQMKFERSKAALDMMTHLFEVEIQQEEKEEGQ